MQFLVIGYDGTDPEAAQRRLAVRAQHLEGTRRLHENGHLISAAAILDNDGSMIGSIMIVEFESEDALCRQWLDDEPYVTGQVWQTMAVSPCAVPGFLMEEK